MTENNTPREVDEKLAALHGEANQCEQAVASAAKSIFYTAGARRTHARRGQGPAWTMSFTDARAAVQQATGDEGQPWKAQEAQETVARYEQAKAALAEKIVEITVQQRLYTGWNRFFVVPGGHIHSSRSCSTCYATTSFGWLPYLSGKTEAEAIEHFGPAAECLCSVCFPNAPVADRNLTQKQTDALLAGNSPEAAPVIEYCPGSGEPSATPVNHRLYSPQAKCPECGHVGAATSSGRVRKHKPKAK